MTKFSDAQRRATEKYNRGNYDEIKLRVRKGEKELLRKHAKRHYQSMNAFLNRAIRMAVEYDLKQDEQED